MGTFKEWRLETEIIGVYKQTNLIGKIYGDSWYKRGQLVTFKDVKYSNYKGEYTFLYRQKRYFAHVNTRKDLPNEMG